MHNNAETGDFIFNPPFVGYHKTCSSRSIAQVKWELCSPESCHFTANPLTAKIRHCEAIRKRLMSLASGRRDLMVVEFYVSPRVTEGVGALTKTIDLVLPT
jgi:hypothetical protein